MGRNPKITELLIDKAFDLAKAGFSHKQIQAALGISHTAFYKNVALVDTVKKAESGLREEVANALFKRAVNQDDTTALIFLAKRLNLYCSSINIEVKDSKSALDGLSKLINANIPLEQKNSLKSIIESYLKGVEIVELEDRILKLEEQYEQVKK
ncbi:hypothetical protein Arnit_0619 [Arcobacter nitrofigilis DSM 7299]|uniref:Uncharacterized protein n=1 Tax=Arcobacter nitrofigilis (strain ATCC 33309 / DSM 7299 / CCUG 15893 / LMG 7604 / NCTC 12251 / CI) TaxID=572480 RepID=D5V251_ARCNC|nr:hypothetical protein [Arcobacter nitrofigilis]ADG92284.1 hypothetical protein Arnit_0619 [Arcobacter nitrofigilis DSM 7299]